VKKVTWAPRSFITSVQGNAQDRVRDCVALAVQTAKDNMLHMDVPSPPGGYPRVDYGTLRDNITFELIVGATQIVGRWGVLKREAEGKSLDYAYWLEVGTEHMKQRPWLSLTMDQVWGDWKRMLGAI